MEKQRLSFSFLEWIHRQERERTISEAADIVRDFLNNGQHIRQAGGGEYGGTLSLRLQKRSFGRYGFLICMYDCGDIRRYPADDPDFSEFLRRYGSRYDPERNALVCRTRHSAAGDPKELTEILSQKIRELPLAEVYPDLRIATRGLK